MIESISFEDEGESLKCHKTRITNNQFAVMVDFLTLNPELIGKDFTGLFTKEKYFKKWEELAALLNADFTGAKKDVQSWRKCWRDRKSHLKTKVEKRDACLLEGTDPSPYQLTDVEERLLQLIKEHEPDNTKYIKNLKDCNKPSVPLKAKSNQQDVKNINIQQKIKDNVCQILGILNKQGGTKSISQVMNNPVSQPITVNNTPTGLLPTNYLLLTIDADTLRTVTPPSLTSDPSNSTVVQIESPSDISVRQTNIPNSAEINVLPDGSCILEDSKNKLRNKDDAQDLGNTNNFEKINIDAAQEVPAKEINSNSLISEISVSAISNSNEDAIVSRSKSDIELINVSSEEDSVGKPPRKKVKFATHAESSILREDGSVLLKAIERQNQLLEGMAKTLTRIEKSLEERSAKEAQEKNSMLVKISDNLEQLGESLRTASKSLKSIGEQ